MESNGKRDMTETANCDVLVVGTGAAGLTAAITAKKAGLKVIVIEKEPLFGGTTAYSGGMIWIPDNKHEIDANKASGKNDSIATARQYILEEAGRCADPDKVDAYLKHGKEMVEYMERESEAKFYSMDYPDYVSENSNSRTQRGLCTVNYETSKMGEHLKELRNQLPQTLFLGLAIGSSVEMKEFMRAGRSIKSMGFVVKKLSSHARDMLLYGRSEQMVRGRALVGRLARTVFDLEIPMWLKSPMKELIVENGRVVGAIVETPKGAMRVNASRGVILACGGYGRDAARRKATYPRVAGGENHPTVVPMGNTGDGVRAAEAVGAKFTADVTQVGSWMAVSQIPGVTGIEGSWPHLVDRQKPGFIAVTRKGNRFVDESSSYHHFIAGMIRANEKEGESEAAAWLIADANAIKRWGMGFVRPFPVPKSKYLRNGYLKRGATLAELAKTIGVDPAGLQATVKKFNENAKKGVDPDFNRGNRVYDTYQGDDENKPNSCLAPLEKGPFYAVRLYVGEIGTFAGIKTDANARALNQANQPIPGLYAIGNDQVSVFGGTYPGPGSTIGPAMTFGYIAAKHAAGLLDATAAHSRAPAAAAAPASVGTMR
jgi:succinate dehydrogenase/fumarate reductase flavoprotein subunit